MFNPAKHLIGFEFEGSANPLGNDSEYSMWKNGLNNPVEELRKYITTHKASLGNYDFSGTNLTKDFYEKLQFLGIIPNEIRKGNVGKSDYSQHIIQPWSIWLDYKLNPWDADVIKRILRTKEEPGMSAIEARIMDYEKIIHNCQEKIRQLKQKTIIMYLKQKKTQKKFK